MVHLEYTSYKTNLFIILGIYLLSLFTLFGSDHNVMMKQFTYMYIGLCFVFFFFLSVAMSKEPEV